MPTELKASDKARPTRAKPGSSGPENQEGTPMFRTFDKFFLIAAFISFLMSVTLWFLVKQEYGQFVGLWVPSILVLWVGVRLCVTEHSTSGPGRMS
jgi:hypothetical protein